MKFFSLFLWFMVGEGWDAGGSPARLSSGRVAASPAAAGPLGPGGPPGFQLPPGHLAAALAAPPPSSVPPPEGFLLG